MKKIWVVLSLVVMATFWYSCTKDTAPSATGNTGVCDSTKVYFTKNILPIINDQCGTTACHATGSSNSDLTSYVVSKGDIDNILCRIWAPGTTHCGARMPQGQLPLSDSVKAIFVQWKADGLNDCK